MTGTRDVINPEVVDLVEGREPGADAAESRNLAAETPAFLREIRLRTLYERHVGPSHGLSQETLAAELTVVAEAVQEAVKQWRQGH